MADDWTITLPDDETEQNKQEIVSQETKEKKNSKEPKKSDQTGARSQDLIGTVLEELLTIRDNQLHHPANS